MTNSDSAKLPSFVIIGAMKSATTTLYEQLRQLNGIFMPNLKEPNFFSDDDVYGKGFDWYRKLFEQAKDKDIIGEASTHYTKLPTHPHSFSRLSDALPDVKLIYIMRDPIDRLISQYIHEWSRNNIDVDINEAVRLNPELVKYSCYADQLAPYLEHYGTENVLPVFFERIKHSPQDELVRVARFIGYTGEVTWKETLARTNVSSERIRTNGLTKFLIENPVLSAIRRKLIPTLLRDKVKSRMRMNNRPELSEATRKTLEQIFDVELSKLGRLLGVKLSSHNYKQIVLSQVLEWNNEKNYGKLAPAYD